MTQLDENRPAAPAARVAPARPAATPRRPWTRHLWIPIAGIVLAFLVHYVLPRFGTLDASKSVTRLRPDFPLHYSIVAAHVIGGVLAMLTGILQLMPWLRRRYPSVHRLLGYGYVAGALTAATMVVPLLLLKGAEANTSGFFWAGAWFWTTVASMLAARDGRFAEHRRWSAYSFALTFSIIITGVAGDVGFRYPEYVDPMVVLNVISWLPTFLSLGIAHWWVSRPTRRPTAAPAATPA